MAMTRSWVNEIADYLGPRGEVDSVPKAANGCRSVMFG